MVSKVLFNILVIVFLNLSKSKINNQSYWYLDFFDVDVPPCLKPFIIFITKTENLSLKKYKDYIKEKEIDFDERNIFLYNTNILKNELPLRLWRTCC